MNDGWVASPLNLPHTRLQPLTAHRVQQGRPQALSAQGQMAPRKAGAVSSAGQCDVAGQAHHCGCDVLCGGTNKKGWIRLQVGKNHISYSDVRSGDTFTVMLRNLHLQDLSPDQALPILILNSQSSLVYLIVCYFLK